MLSCIHHISDGASKVSRHLGFVLVPISPPGNVTMSPQATPNLSRPLHRSSVRKPSLPADSASQ